MARKPLPDRLPQARPPRTSLTCPRQPRRTLAPHTTPLHLLARTRKARNLLSRTSTPLRRQSRRPVPSRGLPHPDGWFAVAATEDVLPGQVITRRLADRDIVVARMRSGELTASEPWCPHLGAHLGGGTVTAVGLRCPFHGLEFNAQGDCAASPLGRPPRTARLAMLPVREILGVIVVWHGRDGGDPEWEITEISADPQDWLPLRYKVLQFRGHPQEITENSVDLAHLSVLHQFRSVNVRQPLHADGPRLRTAYSAQLDRVPILGTLDVEFAVAVDGLGWSRVETTLPRLGWTVRQLVLPTVTDAGTVELRLAVSVRRRTGRPRWLWTVITRAVQEAVLYRFQREVLADREIWENKVFLERPALIPGDGPIGPYRRWTKQFYDQPALTPAD
ncbi:Rieske 2Fe-2S domain-containing protein [Nocardia tengchongensis]|uniref:Rieske 2Fe-2S domain-containing protein n=1 Tax=Nocardia tengchongensis TaxID=2055889 RepID=UPI00365BCCAB